MLQRIKTDGGERWAIVFGEHFSLEDYVNLQNGLINVLQASTHSEMLCGMGEDLFCVFDLLEAITPTHTQAYEYEQYLKGKQTKN
jgi:hypothetical protein